MPKKTTKNQQRILALLTDAAGEVSAQDIHFQIKQQELRIGLATVYRTLKRLKIEGKIQERITPDGESFYSTINAVEHHHHHLNCVNCGESYPMESCPLSHKISEWCNAQKFQVYYHTLEFFGLCENCQDNYDDAECLSAN
ncbi:zinc uptake regulator, Fur family [[Leptolyngbya] sp. PCC 7376]|uniref:Fur family transcriptional regulator n=1 Tax=[Leptolyngbya] sp. PCC 7376 TaxID=111781 RepID=UPI00029EE048|nr:Fur family transcriptional regulator [[Leptolyngbya] sp. PCC 7376]AFY38779.1 zinc uptake regulator, Fur family [[Leptolyngbya] sp. PCC 7376]